MPSQGVPAYHTKIVEVEGRVYNKHLEDVSQDPDEWITELESLQLKMDNNDIASKMTDRDFIIRIIWKED